MTSNQRHAQVAPNSTGWIKKGCVRLHNLDQGVGLRESIIWVQVRGLRFGGPRKIMLQP